MNTDSMQTNLFEVPIQLPTPPKDMCKNCIHIYKHYYNDTKYCKKKKSKHRTSYGDKKIKANDAACELFEQKENK
jgi:hypothetical protein